MTPTLKGACPGNSACTSASTARTCATSSTSVIIGSSRRHCPGPVHGEDRAQLLAQQLRMGKTGAHAAHAQCRILLGRQVQVSNRLVTAGIERADRQRPRPQGIGDLLVGAGSARPASVRSGAPGTGTPCATTRSPRRRCAPRPAPRRRSRYWRAPGCACHRACEPPPGRRTVRRRHARAAPGPAHRLRPVAPVTAQLDEAALRIQHHPGALRDIHDPAAQRRQRRDSHGGGQDRHVRSRAPLGGAQACHARALQGEQLRGQQLARDDDRLRRQCLAPRRPVPGAVRRAPAPQDPSDHPRARAGAHR